MNKSRLKTFRLSSEDQELLRDGARRNGMSESAWIRYLLRVGINMKISISGGKMKLLKED